MDAILAYDHVKQDDFYEILGCDELSSTEQITAEYKARARDAHPDKNLGSPTAGARFAKLQKAKEILCDPEKRRDYDRWRGCGMAMSYEDWCAKRDTLHTSLHWACKSKKDPAIEASPPASHLIDTEQDNNCASTEWGWSNDFVCDSLQQFRNYQI